MSLTLYCTFERFDAKQNKWVDANLYEKTDGGQYAVADLFIGNRTNAGALMGEEAFDLCADCESNDVLTELQDFINDRVLLHSEPYDASLETKAQFDRMRQENEQVPFSMGVPNTVTFTLSDMGYIRNAAALISKEATAFYSTHFRRVEEALRVLAMAHFVFNARYIRAIIWAQ